MLLCQPCPHALCSCLARFRPCTVASFVSLPRIWREKSGKTQYFIQDFCLGCGSANIYLVHVMRKKRLCVYLCDWFFSGKFSARERERERGASVARCMCWQWWVSWRRLVVGKAQYQHSCDRAVTCCPLSLLSLHLNNPPHPNSASQCGNS